MPVKKMPEPKQFGCRYRHSRCNWSVFNRTPATLTKVFHGFSQSLRLVPI